MRSSWRFGQWRGVPTSLHWTVFIGVPWFFYLTRNLAETAIAFVALFLLLLVHELGHAAVAHRRRIEVDRIELFFIHWHLRDGTTALCCECSSRQRR